VILFKLSLEKMSPKKYVEGAIESGESSGTILEKSLFENRSGLATEKGRNLFSRRGLRKS
jgi:hypothetical protein